VVSETDCVQDFGSCAENPTEIDMRMGCLSREARWQDAAALDIGRRQWEGSGVRYRGGRWEGMVR
jgi:hypothetical protein